MTRRRTTAAERARRQSPEDGAGVLVVGGPSRPLEDQLREIRAACVFVDSGTAAREKLDERYFDCVIVSTSIGARQWTGLVAEVCGRDPAPAVLVVGDRPSVDDAVEAMRSGAKDYIDTEIPAPELADRLGDAVARAADDRHKTERINQLRSACQELEDARSELACQVTDLCGELVGAYNEMSEQLSMATTTCEFVSLIRRELDIEELLRSVLEYLLAKLGPTNAAVFLPGQSGDFTLGAYVNYDGPRESAEIVFEQLADVIPSRFEDASEVCVLDSLEAMEAALGDEAHWLEQQSAVVLPCRGGEKNDEECLAVCLLFRSERTPIEAEQTPLLRMVAEQFGRQLARVVKVHHRQLPDDHWGRSGEPDNGADGFGMAA
ncbi:MAG: hypothetical protein JJU33_02860 [Phycisphaerales bacterium]|nr:hypothetical protein [Phycisphaerales bacterium]